MNVQDIAAQLFIKKLDVKYINDENRKHVESLAASCFEAATIFINAEVNARRENRAVVQLELPFPESEL